MGSGLVFPAGFNPLQSAMGVCESALVVRRATQYLDMPWPNGMGRTKELYLSPPGSKVGDSSALWRVSMATVSPGPDKPKEPIPFSPLPAVYQRIITVVDGPGFKLKNKKDGSEVTIEQGGIHQFGGADEIDCELIRGTTLDLNVMYKPALVKAQMQLFAQEGTFPESEPRLTVKPNQILMLICLAGRDVKVDIEGSGWLSLSQYDSMFYYDQRRESPFNFRATLNSRFAAVWINPAREE